MPLVEYIKQYGRFSRNARLYLLSNGLGGVTLGIILVLYNLYLVSLGYATDFIGLVLFVGAVGAGVAIFPAGICMDRFGGKALLIWASVLIGIAGAGQMLFRTPILLCISVFVVGIGGAFMLVVNAPFLTANSTPAERPHLFSLNIVVTLATTVLGEIVGGALPLWLRHIPWLMAPLPSWCAWTLAHNPLARSYQLALLFAGIIAVPSFIPLFLLRDDRPATRSRGEDAVVPVILASQTTLPSAKAENSVSLSSFPAGAPSSYTPFTLRQGRKNLVLWWQRLEPRTLLLSPMTALIIVQILIGLGAGMFIPYFNVYFVRHLGASSALFGVIDGAANTLNAVLTLLAPWIVLRIGRLATLVLPRLLSFPLLLIVGLTGSLPLAAGLYPLRQGLMDMSQGILQVYSMEVVPQRQRGLANSSYQAAFQVAYALGAPAGGVIIARLGYAPVFIAATILYLLAIATLWARFGAAGKI